MNPCRWLQHLPPEWPRKCLPPLIPECDTAAMDRKRSNWKVIALFLALHAVATAFTWRDIGHRPKSQIRGSKWFWRMASGANTGGSIAYFMCGRRRT